jgi:hypothetical protein
LSYKADVAVLWTYSAKVDSLRRHFLGEFAELSWMSTTEILRTLLTQDLVLHPGIQARVDAFRARHLHGRTVGVHLRLSDRRIRVRALLDALDALLDREPDLKIFAATDNIEAKTMLEQRYRSVITTPHWYPAPGKRLHNNPQGPDPAESGVEALVDLYLLGGCDYLIGDTTSSFTRVAGLLMAAPDGKIIDVKPRQKRHIRLRRQIVRYAVSDSAVSRILRPGVRAVAFSRLPSRALVLLARAVPARHRKDRGGVSS